MNNLGYPRTFFVRLFLILVPALILFSSCSASIDYNPLATLVMQSTLEKVFFTATPIILTPTSTPSLTPTPRYTRPISVDNVQDLVEVEQLGGSGYLYWPPGGDQLLSASNRSIVSYQPNTLEQTGRVTFPVAVSPSDGFFSPGNFLFFRGFIWWDLNFRPVDPNIYLLDSFGGSIIKTIPWDDTATALASSTDGSLLAIGDPDGPISIWSNIKGYTVRTLRGVKQPRTAPQRMPARTLVFSPSGQELLSISSNSILQLWEVETGSLLINYGNYEGAAFSPDGVYFASIFSRSELHIRTVADGTLVKVIPILSLTSFIEFPTYLTYSTDGHYIASGFSDGAVYVWKIDDGSLSFMHKGNRVSINNLVFSPDGSLLFIENQEGEIQSWDIVSKTLLISRAGGLGGQGIIFTPDGNIIASGSSNKIFLWDKLSSSLITSAEVWPRWFTDIKLSLQGDLIAVASSSGGTVIYNFPELTVLQGLDGYQSLAFSPDANMLSTCGEENRIWNLSGGEYVRVDYSEYPNPPCSVTTFSPDGEYLVSGSFDGFLHFLNITNQTYEKHPFAGSGITSLAYSPDGSILTAVASRDTSIRLLAPSNATLITALIGHTKRVTGFAFSPDGTLLASTSEDNTLRLWSVSDALLLRTIPTLLPANENSISFSPDGTLLAVGFVDGSIRSWAMLNP